MLDLIKIIERHATKIGTHGTDIPSLFLAYRSKPVGPLYGVHTPSLCIVVQGDKEVYLAGDVFQYGPGDYLISSVNVPITGHVKSASSENPFLCLKLEFTPNQILEVLQETQMELNSKDNGHRGMYVNNLTSTLLDAVTRLVQLLDTPQDIPVLSPLIIKEIIYRILQEPRGHILGQMALEGSSTYKISDTIEYITANYTESFKIQELAQIANMSTSTLHRYFKEVTAMSPLQFQKQLRLQEARQLLLLESNDATEVAFRVGYESASQFSREYSRMFGLPPKEDAKQLKAQRNSA